MKLTPGEKKTLSSFPARKGAVVTIKKLYNSVANHMRPKSSVRRELQQLRTKGLVAFTDYAGTYKEVV